MLAIITPKGVRALADRFKDLFISYPDLCALISYFLLGCNSLSDLARMAPVTRSVSSLSRSIQLFPSNRFMRRLRASLLRHYKGAAEQKDRFVWAIDDTANPKYGAEVFRAGRWHGSSGPWHGQKVIVLALIDVERGIALPAAYVIATKKGDADYKSGPELAVELLKTALQEGLPKVPVVVDSWFDSKDFIEKIEDLGLTYVGELKSRRKVKLNPGRYVPWENIKSAFQGKKRMSVRSRFDSIKVKMKKKRPKVAAQHSLWIKGRRKALNAIAVYNRRNGREPFGYYASTDHSMSRARIWEICRARWKIEVMFRDLKQHLSFGKVPSGSEHAADLAVCLPMLILVSMRLHGEAIWDSHASGTIGEMTDQIRERSFLRSIDFIINGEDKDTIRRLKSRRNLKRLNKKPVDWLAEAA